MKRTHTTVLAAAAAALAVALVAIPVASQPVAGHHAMMGQGGGDHLGHIIQKAQAQLNLNSSQLQMFNDNVATTKAAFAAGHAQMQTVHDALAVELAKPEPDLAAVAAAADAAQQQGTALRHQVRDAWLALYATFSVDQKTVVKNILQQHLAKMDSIHQKIQQHLMTNGS